MSYKYTFTTKRKLRPMVTTIPAFPKTYYVILYRENQWGNFEIKVFNQLFDSYAKARDFANDFGGIISIEQVTKWPEGMGLWPS